MKKVSFILLLSCISIFATETIRNPFEFPTLHETSAPKTNEPTQLNDWNIKEHNNQLILENKEDGQLRIIQMVSLSPSNH